ncbi:hypothetical protein AKJ09_10352 [Labilithrix luteola]|uniref:Uncharacterized protein n=1 Tax=Labilithrix luteola TaxID=1391654 RepID=A0A0K1QD58_9BACT|nr:hypothetical protein AKJ09_10352 [Labilithrix luteola]
MRRIVNPGSPGPERLVANLARASPTRLAVEPWAFRAEFR